MGEATRERSEDSSAWRPVWRAAKVLAALIIAPLAVYGVIEIIEELRDPPPIAEQLDDISREVVANNDRVILRQSADLRGAGVNSFYFVIRNEDARQGADEPGSGRSDELRIYDDVDGDLKLRFRFRPTRTRVQQPLFSRFEGARDFDRDGTGEVIGGFGEAYHAASSLVVPFVIRWEQEAARYRISGLLDEVRRLYPRDTGPRILVEGDEDEINSLGVDDYTVAWSSRLRAAFLATATRFRASSDGVSWDVRSWTVNWKGPRPVARECGLPRKNRRITAPSPFEADVPRLLRRRALNPVICP